MGKKTKRQIEHFLRKAKYKTEYDFKKINAFCKIEYGIKLHVPSNYYSDMETAIDNKSFDKWYNLGYGGGDVVEHDGSFYLVQDSTANEVKMCFKMDEKGSCETQISFPVSEVHPADKSVLNRILEALFEQGMDFDEADFKVIEKIKPFSNSFVLFHNHKTGQKGYGVFRNIADDGEVIFYCHITFGEPVKYSMKERMGKWDDISFKTFKASDYGRKALENALKNVGKTWNHRLLRIEPVDMKVAKGEKYWYITDKMKVESAIEKETFTSNSRYLTGNYFRHEEDAVNIMEEEMELRRNFFAKPNKPE